MAYYTQSQLDAMRKTLKYAKENPEEQKSKEIFKRINAGQMNFELKALGLDPVKVSQPKINLAQAMQAGGATPIQAEDDVPKGSNVDVQRIGGQLMSVPRGPQSIPGQTAREDRGQDIREGFSELQQVVPQRGREAAERLRMMGDPKTFGQGGFGLVAQGLGALFDTGLIVAKTALKAGLSPDQEQKLKETLARMAENPAVAGPMSLIENTMNEIEQTDPDLADSLRDAGILSEAIIPSTRPVRTTLEVAGEGIREGAETLGRQAARGGEVLERGIQSGAVRAGTTLDTLTADAKARRIADQEGRVDQAVADILRAGADDKAIEAGKRTFERIDPKSIETYDDLVNTINDDLSTLAKKQNELLSQFDQKFTSNDLVKTTDVAGEAVSQNFVEDALTQLVKYFEATNDPVEATRYRQLAKQMKEDGLTIGQMNEIAKDHGMKLTGFNANGELASGLNRQSFEKTRSGVKQTLRTKVEEVADQDTRKVTEALDSSMSDIYEIRPYLEKLEDQTAKLWQRTRKPSVRDQLVKAGAITTNILTLGSLERAFPRVLPGMRINESLSYLETQKLLKDNLAEIEKLNQIKNEKSFAEAMANYMKNIQPGMSIRANVRPDLVAKNIDAKDFRIITSIIDDSQMRNYHADTIKAMGLENATDEELVSFLKEVVDEFEGVADRNVLIDTDKPPVRKASFNQGATPSTNLLEEAKGKSLEEFIESQGKTVHHATDSDIFDPATFDPLKSIRADDRYFNPLGEGMYVSSNKDFVKRFGKNRMELVLPNDAKIKTVSIDDWESDFPEISQNIIDELGLTWSDFTSAERQIINRLVPDTPINSMNQFEVILQDAVERKGIKKSVQQAMQSVVDDMNDGFDAVVYTDTDYAFDADEIVVKNPSILKTRTQLEDIWRQANQ